MTDPRCTGCSHPNHPPGECTNKIITAGGKNPTEAPCPCIYLRPRRGK